MVYIEDNVYLLRRIIFAVILALLVYVGPSVWAGWQPWQRVQATPLQTSWLLMPPQCVLESCDLLVLSHARGKQAGDILGNVRWQRLLWQLLQGGYVLLLSDDAGPRTWGNPQALYALQNAWQQAKGRFKFSGQTYVMGYSMGGLPATLAANRQLFPVSALVLLDARVNLQAVWQKGDLERRQEIADAFKITLQDALPSGYDPLNDFERVQVPMLVLGSLQDKTVPLIDNGLALLRKSPNILSQLALLSGDHLGGQHLSARVGHQILGFLASIRASKQYQP